MPRFCEYQTIFSLAQAAGFVGSPYKFYEKYIVQQYKRMRDGVQVAQGDLAIGKGELLFYSIRKPVFRVYSAMAEALTTTNIEVPSDEVHLPFPILEIQLEPETFWLDPQSAQGFVPGEDIQKLKGRPYLCALLVKEAPIYTGSEELKRKIIPGTTVLQVFWDIRDTANPENVIDARSYVGLIPNKTVFDGVDLIESQYFKGGLEDRKRIASLVIGTIFLAISRNRRWVSQTRIKIRGKDWCLCGSGRRYKHCCVKTKTRGGDPIGFVIGKGIDLPYAPSRSSITVEGRGQELQYSHFRTGHMKWQSKNDAEGNLIKELIFIAPTIVRPDLPLKSKLTPRRIRPKKPPKKYYRFNPDEDLRALEREYQSTGDPEIWAQLQVRRQRAGLLYDRAYILRVQSHEQILRKLQMARRWQPGIRHGEHLLVTKLSNGWHIETWWDDNEWDEYGLYPGEFIAWTTLVYDDPEEGHQVGSAVYCQTMDCAITHHREKVQSIIDGTIEEYGGTLPLWNAEPRRNPECFTCLSDPCRCDPKYRHWLDQIDELLFAAVGMRKLELPCDYMWADAFENGFSPTAAINMMVGPLNDPERLKEAIYIEAAGLGCYQREHKLSNEEIGNIALDILKEEVKRVNHYYHGSPYSGLTSTAEFEGRYLFLTPSPGVAKDYTVQLPASGKRPKNREVFNQKTIYTLVVILPENAIFDTRKPEHHQLYSEIRNQIKLETDPEDWPSRDLIATPDLPDSPISTAGFYPDFGSGLNIIPKLQEYGFRALWVSEGSQGASLGLFYPEDAKIIDTQYLD